MRDKNEMPRGSSGLFRLPGFHIESDSPGQLVVEGCTGIMLYEQERIRLGIGRRALLVTGDGLAIDSMFGSTLIISGNIATIEYI